MRLQQTLQNFRNRFKNKRRHQPAKKKSRRLQLEHLEDRTLLSTILWTNKGNSGSDTDGFNAVFGSNADIARSDVQAAIDEWAQAIVNFNYQTVFGVDPFNNTFSLNISMGGPGNGASAGGPSVWFGKPTSGSISMGSGSDGHGGGWYLDPTPNFSEEFRGTITNNYAMNATPGGPADGLGDFETVALAEVTHEMGQFPCCGLDWQSTSFLNNSGQSDAAATGTLYTFTSPSTLELITTDNAGGEFGAPVHTAEPNAGNVVVFNGNTYYGSQNNGNAFYEFSRRYLLSNMTVLALGDTYGYTVAVPTQNAYINYDPNTGNLLVRGGSHGENIYPSQANPSNDTITIDSGFFFGIPFITASVSIGNPTPGTGPNITYSNLYFGVTSVTVDGNDGTGSINVNSTISGIPVTINESSGNTTVNITPSTEFMDHIQGNVFVNGGTGTDTLNVDDQNDGFNDTWTITGSSLTRTAAATIFYNFQDNVNINGGSGNLTYNVLSTEAFFTTSIDTGPGTDTVNVQSTAIFSTLNINNLFSTSNQDTVNIGSLAPSLGGTMANIAGTVNVANSSGGGTTLTLDDSGDTTGRTFTVTSGSITGTAFGGAVNYNGGEVKFLNLLGGDGGNTFNVQSTASGTTTSINTDATSTFNSNNHVNIGSLAPSLGGTMANIAGPVNVSSSSGSTTLTLDDSGDTTGQSVTLTNNSISGTWAPAAVNYANVSTLTIEGGSGIDTYNVQSTASGTVTNLVLQSLSRVNVGSIAPTLGGTLAGIAGPLNVSNASVLVLDDSGDSTGQTVTITNGSVSGTWSPAAINYANVGTLDIEGGSGLDTYNVQSTASGTTTNLVLQSASLVQVGSLAPTLGGTLAGIAGPLNVSNASVLGVDDSGDGTGRTATITNNSISGTWSPATITYTNVSSVTIDGPSGGSTYNINSTAFGVSYTFNAGAGNDTFNMAPASEFMDNVQGAITVNGGGGTNTLTIFDQNDTFGGDTYNVTSTTVGRNASALITYSGMASLLINGSLTVDITYNINSTAAGTPVTILAGAGNDTFNITPANQNFSNIGGALTLNGGGGTNSLTVDDQLDPTANDAYTIAVGTVQRTGTALVSYSNMQSELINGGPNNVTYNVNSTAASTPVTILAGAGNDTFNIGTGNLDSLAGAVSVNGGGGSNTVNINDQAKGGVQTYVVTSSTVTRGPTFGGLTYASIQTLVLNGGTGADFYNIQSTSAATTVNGGIGNDTFNVGNAGVLDGILGTLTVNGAGGSNNTLTIDDHLNGVGQSFTLANNLLTRSGGVTINYVIPTIKTVTIKAGAGSDAFLVSVAPTTTTVLDLGGGNNTLTGPNATNTWTITSTNHGTLGTKLTFSNAQNLTGGTGNDTFKFVGAGANITGNLNGGGGTADKLDYSLDGALAISVNLATGVASRIGGTFSNIESLAGSTAATDTLTGANIFNNWSITGANAGKLNTVFSFTGIENLVGGTNVDVFKFAAAGTEGSINGGGAPLHQGDWLDYSGVASAVTVNLAAGTAQIGGGPIVAVSNIQDVHGGNGLSTLTGNSQGNILLGGGGAVNITGGSGLSLLIADKGAGTIKGNSGASASGGDILIGGTTIWDSDTNAHLISLMAVLAEWQNTAAHTYAQRVSFLRGGGGLNGTNKLIFGTTVKDNGVADVLTAATAGPGTPAVDWFFTGALDTAVNTETGEAHNNGTF